MNLSTLLDKALICTWDRATWFDGVTLVGASLMVPDKARAATIQRCFLPQLEPFFPGLDVVACAPRLDSQKEKPAQKAYRGEPVGAFKKGKSPAERLARASQADMFGDGES